MDDSVLLQFGERDVTFPTDAADVFPKVLTAVHRGKMVLKQRGLLRLTLRK